VGAKLGLRFGETAGLRVGRLDAEYRAVNDPGLRAGRGRLLSSYRVPAEISSTITETLVWVITDHLEDPDTATTVLWPADY
jgi:hypothetical protein